MRPIEYGFSHMMHGWLLSTLMLAAFGLVPPPVMAEAVAAEATAVASTGQRFVTAINTADGSGLNELMDADGIAARVLAKLKLNVVDRALYVEILSTEYSTLGYSVAAQMLAQRAKATLLRSSPAGDGGAGGEFLARITTTDAKDNEAFGYLQVSLDREGRIVDWYDHSLAVSMSGQLAFSAVKMMTATQVAQLLLGQAGDAREIATLMTSFASAVNAGDMQLAHALLLEMPESIKQRREFATLRVTMARSVSMQAYGEALAELARRHGTADELQFILIDHYLLTGQFELALRAVDRAARVIGDDEVMDANRCHALLDLGRKADALAACDRSIARDPTFELPRWTRVRLALQTKDAPLAIQSLTGVEQARGGKKLNAGSLAKNSSYAWLAKQPEFAAWGADRGWSPPP